MSRCRCGRQNALQAIMGGGGHCYLCEHPVSVLSFVLFLFPVYDKRGLLALMAVMFCCG